MRNSVRLCARVVERHIFPIQYVCCDARLRVAEDPHSKQVYQIPELAYYSGPTPVYLIATLGDPI